MKFVYILTALAGLGFAIWLGIIIVTRISNRLDERKRNR